MVRKRLFFDIETSFNVGIFWRSGYNLTINPVISYTRELLSASAINGNQRMMYNS
jgi:hypothetical protein